MAIRFEASAQTNKITQEMRAEASRENNLGVAYMNRQQQKQALEEFRKAYASNPELYAARLNEAIALLNLQQFPDAQTILEEARQKEPKNPRVWYNLGFYEKSMGRPGESAKYFERVLSLDPADADCRYFLGQDYMALRNYPKSIEFFESALKLNPFHVSAQFALAQAYQRFGNTDKAREYLTRFQEEIQKKLGTPMSLTYGDQGKYSLAEEVSPGLEAVPLAIPVHFVDVTAASGLPTRAARPSESSDADISGTPIGSGACILDYDGDGRPDIFLANADGGGRPGLYHNLGNGHFEDVTKSSGIEIPAAGVGCTIGDYDNDGRPDIAVSYAGGVSLFHNEGNGRFRDVSSSAGIHVTGQAMGLTFADYDHDGDLDLYVTRGVSTVKNSQDSPVMQSNELWRNNGNGTFTDVTSETGLAVPGGSWGATVSDVNNDRAIDFVVASMNTPPTIFFNPREGKFRADKPWSSPMPAPAVGALAFDFDKDGWMDLAFTHSGTPGLSLWRNEDGKTFAPVELPKLNWTRGWGLAALDYDNDGWIDLAAVGENASGGHIALLRNQGPAEFSDVSKEVGLDQIHAMHPRSIVAADFFGDGATDLLITQAEGPPILLRNEGGNRNHWLRLAFKGLNDNKSAIGAKINIYAGTLQQKFEVPSSSGYLGQSDSDITVGLDGEKSADIVRMLWPTGVLQDELNFSSDSRQTITELDRHGSSCPILFAWDGHKFEFISDILGSGIVGHWIAPGQRNIPDPHEYVKLSSSELQPINGMLSLRLLEPMEELDYLDQTRLLAVDHPAGVAVYPNAYFSMDPPFPNFKVIASIDAHPPLGAWDQNGRDVMPLISVRDHQFVPVSQSLPYAGFAKLHWIELDLAKWDFKRPLYLLMDGFTDYFSASSLYSAWQAGLKPIPPYVEELEPDGKWRRVIDEMGFPGGLERTMTADLTGKLRPGTRRIRIVTNLKIYWDRILIDNSPANTPYRVSAVPLVRARLEFRGYPQYSEGRTPGDLSYDYDEVSASGPYAQQSGYYTRYGDVRPLLTRADEKYVIFGSGDEVAVNFDPSSLPKLPRDWTRDYFFYANGFDKDMDFYADYGGTVSPLPIHGLRSYPYPAGIGFPQDLGHLEYMLLYNTRAVSGSAPKSYQFQYHRETP
ncbi:MAG TPA: FG-GAP-like repeat-containing protein [Candidatus Acidoferrales bacterium]|nr:FG-GAP-like repeat-containing protein [Candidatus Acidoferrales bacterium]